MKIAVIVFPGSNCDRDMQGAIKKIIGTEPKMVWHRDTELPKVDLITLPGGFSYGDYLRAGCMAAKSPIMREIINRAKTGTPILGVCNGFQVLTESGLLPGILMRNAGLKYICKDVHLKVINNGTIFTNCYDLDHVIRIPIAHHDGNYYADKDTLNDLEDSGRIAFRYCDESGEISEPANPNGSQHSIAGIFNKKRTVLGMMPHPERLADPYLGGTDGIPIFQGLAAALS